MNSARKRFDLTNLRDVAKDQIWKDRGQLLIGTSHNNSKPVGEFDQLQLRPTLQPETLGALCVPKIATKMQMAAIYQV